MGSLTREERRERTNRESVRVARVHEKTRLFFTLTRRSARVRSFRAPSRSRRRARKKKRLTPRKSRLLSRNETNPEVHLIICQIRKHRDSCHVLRKLGLTFFLVRVFSRSIFSLGDVREPHSCRWLSSLSGRVRERMEKRDWPALVFGWRSRVGALPSALHTARSRRTHTQQRWPPPFPPFASSPPWRASPPARPPPRAPRSSSRCVRLGSRSRDTHARRRRDDARAPGSRPDVACGPFARVAPHCMGHAAGSRR